MSARVRAIRANRPNPVRVVVWLGVLLLVLAPLIAGCAGTKATPPSSIAENEHDPAVWGRYYPDVYRRWLATKDPRPVGLSLYKRGDDGGVMYDKLSEYPFMALLFNGWGFGVEYNEPRGHWWMLIDQEQSDPSRVKSGGACLTCKSPYTQDLYEQDSAKLFAADYTQAVAMLPAQARQLGVSCIDCHDPATMELRTRRWTVTAGLSDLGLAEKNLSTQQEKLLVCGQCHCSYSIMKNGTNVLDVAFQWAGSKWGGISVENMIENLEKEDERLEWTQAVTGMKLAFIRHPDFEFYTADSPHYLAGVSCPDCHMPKTAATNNLPDHDVMSPLNQDMIACTGCHTQTPAVLRQEVLDIQKRDLGLLITTGYKVSAVAKLFQTLNAAHVASSTPEYADAARYYRQAFYRVVYMGAENSVGFHNPDEGERILKDAAAKAAQADSILRKLLTSRHIGVPSEVPLDLIGYLTNRGVKKLDFVRKDYIADPTGAAQKSFPQNLAALLK